MAPVTTTHAQLVPEQVLRDSGTLTLFPTAVQRNYDLCVQASKDVRDEFNKTMGTNIEPSILGEFPTLGTVHVVAFTMPEALPERLEIMTRFADFTILSDDFYETESIGKVSQFNTQLQSSLREGNDELGIPDQTAHQVAIRTKQFQAGIMVEMIKIDKKLAADIMAMYSKGLDTATFSSLGNLTLEAYLPIRLINCGLDVFQEMSCFGLDLHILPAAKVKLAEIVDLALYSTALINDYHSWPKEVAHYMSRPNSELPFNAVPLIMQRDCCSEAEAMAKVRDKAVELQHQHLDLIQRLEIAKGPLSHEHRRYIMAAQYAASGSEFWAIYGPRYPTKDQLKQSECFLVGGNLTFDAPGASVDGALPRLKRKLSVVDSNGHGRGGNEPVAISKKTKNDRTKHDEPYRPDTPVAVESSTVVLDPYKYIASFPSKRFRDTLIDALSSWLPVSSHGLATIKDIVSKLHNSSLMLDDIEDNSRLRRGAPCAHALFGIAQTINSANFVFTSVFADVMRLGSPNTVGIITEEVQNMQRGQALDLYWKHHTHFPTENDYMHMVDQKTGGLFRLCIRLMEAESESRLAIDMAHFTTQLGRYFQIRDDYQNLASSEYAQQKGYCEDLDEGKISLPLIYCSRSATDAQRDILRGIFEHKASGVLPGELKTYVLELLEKTGALNTTLVLLRGMHQSLIAELRTLEARFGVRNALLELALRRLEVSDETT